MGYMNLDDLWFGLMKIVFDRWIMFRMMFGVVWVKKFCDLVEIWGRYEGLKVFGYGGFREKFEWREMFMLENEGRRRNFFWYILHRSRARPCLWGHGPCQLSVIWGLIWAWSDTAVPLQAGAVLGLRASKAQFFSFSWIMIRQWPTKQLKTTKKQTK